MNKIAKTVREAELKFCEALVDEQRHTEFAGSSATCDPRVGRAFTAWDGYIFGKIVSLERVMRIGQQCKTSEWDARYSPSMVEFTFRDTKNGTELTMLHSKMSAGQADSYRQECNDSYWKLLKQYFERKNR